MESYSQKMKTFLEAKGKNAEPVFVNFPGDCVIYALNGSAYNPYCKHCHNSLIIQRLDEPFNNFDDTIKGFCDKCNKVYPIRYV